MKLAIFVLSFIYLVRHKHALISLGHINRYLITKGIFLIERLVWELDLTWTWTLFYFSKSARGEGLTNWANKTEFANYRITSLFRKNIELGENVGSMTWNSLVCILHGQYSGICGLVEWLPIGKCNPSLAWKKWMFSKINVDDDDDH